MGFWVKFAIDEALFVVQAFLASAKTTLTPNQIAALEAFITQTQQLLAAF